MLLVKKRGHSTQKNVAVDCNGGWFWVVCNYVSEGWILYFWLTAIYYIFDDGYRDCET